MIVERAIDDLREKEKEREREREPERPSLRQSDFDVS